MMHWRGVIHSFIYCLSSEVCICLHRQVADYNIQSLYPTREFLKSSIIFNTVNIAWPWTLVLSPSSSSGDVWGIFVCSTKGEGAKNP